MKGITTNINGCMLLQPKVYGDHRGWFYESYRKEELDAVLGDPVSFVQDNVSLSHKHVLRGMHFQKGKKAQSKLVNVLKGRVLDVVVDLRPDSPSFMESFSIELSCEDGQMLFIPKGTAHGFLSLEDHTIFCYKCDAYYDPESEGGIRFDDPDLAIDWGIPHSELILSEKDRKLPLLKDLSL